VKGGEGHRQVLES